MPPRAASAAAWLGPGPSTTVLPKNSLSPVLCFIPSQGRAAPAACPSLPQGGGRPLRLDPRPGSESRPLPCAFGPAGLSVAVPALSLLQSLCKPHQRSLPCPPGPCPWWDRGQRAEQGAGAPGRCPYPAHASGGSPAQCRAVIRVCRGLLRWHLCLPTVPATFPWVQSPWATSCSPQAGARGCVCVWPAPGSRDRPGTGAVRVELRGCR